MVVENWLSNPTATCQGKVLNPTRKGKIRLRLVRAKNLSSLLEEFLVFMDKFILGEKSFERFKNELKEAFPDNGIKRMEKILGAKEHPKVFPYFITKLAPSIYHLMILPDIDDIKLVRLAYKQAELNDLKTCLVLNEKQSVYFENKTATISGHRPSGGILVTGQIALSRDLSEQIDFDSSYRERCKMVQEYIKEQQPNKGYMFGDLTKGGREATKKEREELEKPNEEYPEVPNGLVLCEICNEYKGVCLDPSENFKNQIMNVSCKCDNQNRCAKCKKLLYQYKLYANHYKKEDGQIWHVPGFCGLSHKCYNPEDMDAFADKLSAAMVEGLNKHVAEEQKKKVKKEVNKEKDL